MPGTPPPVSRNSTGCTLRRCTTRRAWRRVCGPDPYGDYILSVGRIESVKRVDLIVGAMTTVDPPVRLVVAGDGTQRANVERARRSRRDRPRHVPRRRRRRTTARLYADALAVVYPPFDEDFGYVTLEAFLARKPVITCHGLGWTERVRRRRRQRLSAQPRRPTRSAAAINRIAADRRARGATRAMPGTTGRAR